MVFNCTYGVFKTKVLLNNKDIAPLVKGLNKLTTDSPVFEIVYARRKFHLKDSSMTLELNKFIN